MSNIWIPPALAIGKTTNVVRNWGYNAKDHKKLRQWGGCMVMAFVKPTSK